MYIYSIKRDGTPKLKGEARHVRSCDPVVANDSVSFVTLRSGSCGIVEDGLYVYDIKNISDPKQISFVKMEQPYGLGLKGSILYVCRQDQGLTLVNVQNASLPLTVKTIKDATYNDVIPYDDLLICYVGTGLLLYDISDPLNPRKLGNIKYRLQ
jgi:hypothetical protein